MRKLLLILVLMMFPAFSLAQDQPRPPCHQGKPPAAPDDPAAITTFNTLIAVAKLKNVKYNFTCESDGKLTLLYTTQVETTSPVASGLSVKRVFSTTVTGMLSPKDFAKLKDSFVKLKVNLLEDVSPAAEPEEWIGLGCLSGDVAIRFNAEYGKYGKNKEEITQFLNIINDLIEKYTK